MDESPLILKEEINPDIRHRKLFLGCIHIDSKKCQRNLLRRHLEEELSKGNTKLWVGGDLFDVMQAPGDRRSSPSSLKPEYANRYFNDVVKDAVNFFAPYAEHFECLWYGNHETSVLKYHGIDILEWFCNELEAKTGHRPHLRPYQGWIVQRFTRTNSTGRFSFMFYHHHGKGNAPEVTKGRIQMYRRMVKFQADFYLSAHLHKKLASPETISTLNHNYIPIQKNILHLQTGTYKGGSMQGSHWENQGEFGLPDLGGYIIEFYYRNHKVHYKYYETEK